MPTTCGYPSCKFRSRYRGHEDTRHFYRIPKRPLILRQHWLKAIGRTEETVVSQLRICSAHFKDGEKREGDIPVADPEFDAPLSITLPPKENKTNDKRRAKSAQFGLADAMKRLGNPTQQPTHSLPNSFASSQNSTPVDNVYDRLNLSTQRHNRFNSMFMGNTAAMAAAFVNAFKCVTENQTQNSFSKNSQLFALNTPLNIRQNKDSVDFSLNGLFDSSKTSGDESKSGKINENDLPTLNSFLRPTSRLDTSTHESPEQTSLALSILGVGSTFANGAIMRPLVALLDGRDCSNEMGLLKDVATVAFCDAQSASEIHERVLNEAVIALVCYSIRLQREDLQKFKCLKAIIRIGSGTEQFDLAAATELGIAICHTSVQCIEERADSTLSLILNLYRKTFWSIRAVQTSNYPQGIEQLRELASGSRRIRKSQLLVVGLGQIGTAVALRAAAFGFQISFYDPLLPEGYERSFGFTRFTVLDEAIAEADCITFHCPLNSQTKRLVNMTLLKKMKKSVFIVNINSEQLFVESDLLSCLKNGQIGAAAFDSYSFAPSTTFTTNLASLPNVICTPKISWYSDASNKELREAASRQVRQILLGDKSPAEFQNCVNREALLASTSIQPQPSTSFANQARQVPTNNEFSFNSPAYQQLYMMNANNMLAQPSIGLYPPHLINQLNPLSNGSSARKETHSATPRDDRPSSSSSSNQANHHRSSSVVSTTNGQEVEEQRISVSEDNDNAGPSEAKIQKLEIKADEPNEDLKVEVEPPPVD